MSNTAHDMTQTFHAEYDITGFTSAPLSLILETELFAEITTESLLPIEVEGVTGDTVTIQLKAYKLKQSVFIAVGGNI